MTDKHEKLIHDLKLCSEADCFLVAGETYKGQALSGLIREAVDLIMCKEAEVEQYRDFNKEWMEKCGDLKAENEALKEEIKRLQCCAKEKDPYVSALIYRLIMAKDEAVTVAMEDLLSEVNARIYPYKTDIYIKGEELIIIPDSDYNSILSDIRRKFTKKGGE